MKKTISAIIPCYNAEKFLAEAITSLLNQTYPPLEIIVIDDGSTDRSFQVAKSFGGSVKVYRQPNQGESIARNQGIARAQGEFLYFLDADDVVEKTSFEKMINAIKGPESVVLMGLALFRDDPNNPFETHYPQFESFLPDIFQTNFGPPICWLFPAKLVKKIGGFREDLRLSEDWEFCARIALAGGQLVPINHIGALHRVHDQSQVRVTPLKQVRLGHVAVKESICREILKDKKFLYKYGDQAFWSGWVSLIRALNAGASWEEVQALAKLLENIARYSPGNLENSYLIKLIKLLGIRRACRLKRIFGFKGD